jgi:hypothetical protein
MTSRYHLLSVDTITKILHEVVCATGTEQDSELTAEHRRTDRLRAVEVYGALIGAGLINAPVTISDDFLAVS